jgi:hypothetical protein
MRSSPYDQLNDDIPLNPGAVPEESIPVMAQAKARPSVTVEEPPLLLGEPTTPPGPTEPPKSARSDRVSREGPITTEQEWRAELEKLAVLVRDMKEQQADAHKNMLRLHREQQKELQAAIKRVESSAPRGLGSASDKPTASNGVAAEMSVAQSPKKVGCGDLGNHASEVSHPCAVQEPADAGDNDVDLNAAMPNMTDAVVPREGPAVAQALEESRPVRWSHHVSEVMSPHTLHGLAMEFCNKVKHFSELARLHYGSRSPRGGKITKLQWFVNSFYFRAGSRAPTSSR